MSQPQIFAETGNLKKGEGDKDQLPTLTALQLPGEKEKEVRACNLMHCLVLHASLARVLICRDIHSFMYVPSTHMCFASHCVPCVVSQPAS